MCTFWSVALAKKSCNNINNSPAQTYILCYFLRLWFSRSLATALINFKKWHFYKKRESDIYDRSNYATFCFKLRQDFCIAGIKNRLYNKFIVGTYRRPLLKGVGGWGGGGGRLNLPKVWSREGGYQIFC